MITIKIPFHGQSVSNMNQWLQDHGLVYRRDWQWEKIGGNYIYLISPEQSKLATIFTLKWS